MVLRWFRRQTADATGEMEAEYKAAEKPLPRPTLPDPMVPETNLTLFFWRRER